ncbi:MAG: GNAT family N-acetyltransferase [Bacillota bacterium]
MNPVIRPAEAADIEPLARLFVEFHNFHARGVPTHLQPVGDPDEELIRSVGRLLEDERCAIFVASLDDQVVGFAEIYIKETDPSPAVVQRRYALLQSLAVSESQRRLGLGRLLMEEAHRWARGRGATAVETETWEFPEGPLDFYAGLGYITRKRRLVRSL